MKFILSTMTSAIRYVLYADAPKDSKQMIPIKKSFVLHGGKGLPSVTSGFGEMAKTVDNTPMWTPSGIVTPIEESDLEWLMQNHVFKTHMENGFVKILDKDIRGNHTAVAKEARTLTEKDGCAQLTGDSVGKHVKLRQASAGDDDHYRI